jgi:hypothetical protein
VNQEQRTLFLPSRDAETAREIDPLKKIVHLLIGFERLLIFSQNISMFLKLFHVLVQECMQQSPIEVFRLLILNELKSKAEKVETAQYRSFTCSPVWASPVNNFVKQ